jgi:DNA-directed RNA polymerase subunit RPC12/RpoP
MTEDHAGYIRALLERRRACFEMVENAKSYSFRCKYCGQQYLMRKRPGGGVYPGPIDVMCAHADQHLIGHSLATH